MDYCGRAPIVTNTTLTVAGTWYKVTDAINGIRKWRIKAREATSNEYYFCFGAADPNSTPRDYMSNGGSG